MSKHAPWTKEKAENEAFNRMVYGKRLSPHQQEIWLDALAWAAAQIEKCPTIHGGENNMGTLSWSPSKMNGDTHIAKLVGIREVEK